MLARTATALLLITAPVLAPAQELPPQPRYHMQMALYAKHFHPKPDHNNLLRLISLDRIEPSGWLVGGGHFINSFHQPTWYLYLGRRWEYALAGTRTYTKITAGALHGYKGQYQDEVPFNRKGTSPGVLLHAGAWLTEELILEGTLFGAAGFAVTLGYEFR